MIRVTINLKFRHFRHLVSKFEWVLENDFCGNLSGTVLGCQGIESSTVIHIVPLDAPLRKLECDKPFHSKNVRVTHSFFLRPGVAGKAAQISL